MHTLKIFCFTSQIVCVIDAQACVIGSTDEWDARGRVGWRREEGGGQQLKKKEIIS